MKRYMATVLRIGLLPVVLLAYAAVILTAHVSAASAAAGCYDYQVGDGTYHTAVCPAGKTDATKCFVNNVGGPGAGNYVEKDCAAINSTKVVDEKGSGSDDSLTPSDVTIDLTPSKEDCEGGKCISNAIKTLVNALSIGVGVVVTAVIIVSGIQYTMSRDNPQSVQAAKTRIVNAVIGMIAYVFIFAFLQWIIPGGLL